jgi:hypothetical protein
MSVNLSLRLVACSVRTPILGATAGARLESSLDEVTVAATALSWKPSMKHMTRQDPTTCTLQRSQPRASTRMHRSASSLPAPLRHAFHYPCPHSHPRPRPRPRPHLAPPPPGGSCFRSAPSNVARKRTMASGLHRLSRKFKVFHGLALKFASPARCRCRCRPRPPPRLPPRPRPEMLLVHSGRSSECKRAGRTEPRRRPRGSVPTSTSTSTSYRGSSLLNEELIAADERCSAASVSRTCSSGRPLSSNGVDHRTAPVGLPEGQSRSPNFD